MRIRAYLLDIETEGRKPSALCQNPVTISFSQNLFLIILPQVVGRKSRRQIVQKSSATRELPSRARFASDLPTICPSRKSRQQIVCKSSKSRRQLEKYRAEHDLPTICRRFAEDLLNTEPHAMKLNIFHNNR